MWPFSRSLFLNETYEHVWQPPGNSDQTISAESLAELDAYLHEDVLKQMIYTSCESSEYICSGHGLELLQEAASRALRRGQGHLDNE